MSTQLICRRLASLVVCGTTLCCASAQAAALFDRPVGEATLDTVRGGFSTPGAGIVVSFSVQQSVFVDGVLAGTTVLRPVSPEVATSSISTSGVAPSSDGRQRDLPALLLVQRGSGNGIDAGTIASSAAGVVVQNTLDNQKIQTVTTLDVTANSLQAFRGLNLQSSLRGALTDSIRR